MDNIALALARRLPGLLEPLARIPLVRRVVSSLAIDILAGSTSPRPRAFSMAGDYTTWPSLTDRKFTGRHLPPFDWPPDLLPGESDVSLLFQSPKDDKGDDVRAESSDTSVMFSFFAQWFTDSFLRTSRADFRQNT